MVIYHSYVSLPEGNPYEYESQLSKYFAQIIDCLWLSRLLSDFLDNHETTEIKSSIKKMTVMLFIPMISPKTLPAIRLHLSRPRQMHFLGRRRDMAHGIGVIWLNNLEYLQTSIITLLKLLFISQQNRNLTLFYSYIIMMIIDHSRNGYFLTNRGAHRRWQT